MTQAPATLADRPHPFEAQPGSRPLPLPPCQCGLSWGASAHFMLGIPRQRSRDHR